MKVIVSRFDEGMASDRYLREFNIYTPSATFAVAKGFDIWTLPGRLTPNRATTTDTAATGIGNLLTGVDGVIYGIGADANNPTTNSQLYKKPDNASNWSALSNGKTGTSALNFDLFMEYPSNGSRSILCAGNAGIATLDKTNSLTVSTHSLSFNSITQGIVHPKDDIAYIPYTTSGGSTYIASNNAGSWNDTALQLPSDYIVTALAWYGNYLAIACAPKAAFSIASTGKSLAFSANAGAYKSVVYLWDRDASLSTISETIDWGTGILQVLNNLNGDLIGISNQGSSANIADRNSIVIKVYSGGAPDIVREISTRKETTTSPSATINPYVNFIYRDRLYFSADIVGGSTSPAYHGLWSLAKSHISGRYAVTIERGATTNDSETSVLAAAATGDYFSMVYNASGTLGFSVNNSAFSAIFSGTSYYESMVNPNMPAADFSRLKQLKAISVSMVPMTSSGQIVLKYKADNGSWQTVTTYTTANTTGRDTAARFTRIVDATGAQFLKATHYEFRIESTGGAEIVELAYDYEALDSAI